MFEQIGPAAQRDDGWVFDDEQLLGRTGSDVAMNAFLLGPRVAIGHRA
jgi:hypothetical protein